jgi:DNA mismatch endonuclease (patch repair protein)
MRAIKSKNTAPEMAVRRLVHALGYRFRIHRRDLPGTPDLVLSSRQKVIFVHGCYWHGHGCKRGGQGAKSNTDYWGPKIARNRERDITTMAKLKAAGWSVLVIWECEVRDQKALEAEIRSFLGPTFAQQRSLILHSKRTEIL